LIQIQRKSTMAAVAAALTIALLFQITGGTSRAQSNDAALIAKAKAIHGRVLKLERSTASIFEGSYADYRDARVLLDRQAWLSYVCGSVRELPILLRIS
jgi:hypothetical protein